VCIRCHLAQNASINPLAFVIMLSLFITSGCSSIQSASSPSSTTVPAQIEPDSHPKTFPESTPLPPPPVTTSTPASFPTVSPTPSPFFHGPISIGTSVAGRDLEVFQFGSGDSQRMIIAGIHGGYESNTIRLADELIQVIIAKPDLIPTTATLYILRSLNPDGESRSDSYKGRANENLVDLNRNWPAYWQSTWSLEGCWTYTYVSGGSHPASEPETRALMNFLMTYQIEALISYHSAMLGIFPGGQPPDPASISLAEAIAGVSDYYYPPIDTGCQYTGQLIDWASMQGIAAVDIELTNHEDTDLWQNLKILEAFLAWDQDQPNP
ncbi:MAG: M14 family metallopeptidase, partial [Anaerolineales bacterium]